MAVLLFTIYEMAQFMNKYECCKILYASREIDAASEYDPAGEVIFIEKTAQLSKCDGADRFAAIVSVEGEKIVGPI